MKRYQTTGRNTMDGHARLRRWLGALGAVAWLTMGGSGCGSTQGETQPGNCVGVAPPEAAYHASPGPTTPAPATTPTVGDPWPDWQLEDFQPQSCGYGAVYGGEVFRGQVTLVAFWSAW